MEFIQITQNNVKEITPGAQLVEAVSMPTASWHGCCHYIGYRTFVFIVIFVIVFPKFGACVVWYVNANTSRLSQPEGGTIHSKINWKIWKL